MFVVSSHIVATCIDMDNFDTILQKYYPKGILNISWMVPLEKNFVYIFNTLMKLRSVDILITLKFGAHLIWFGESINWMLPQRYYE